MKTSTNPLQKKSSESDNMAHNIHKNSQIGIVDEKWPEDQNPAPNLQKIPKTRKSAEEQNAHRPLDSAGQSTSVNARQGRRVHYKRHLPTAVRSSSNTVSLPNQLRSANCPPLVAAARRGVHPLTQARTPLHPSNSLEKRTTLR